MAKETYTTFEISQFCDVFITTVSKWIDEGRLPAYRTPGGHRRVQRQELIDFLVKYRMPIAESLLVNAEQKVLVVDDNAEMVNLIRKTILSRNPKYVIETAEDGFDAGQKVMAFRPQVIILDLVLPGLDGLQVCRKLRNDPITRSIHVIVITGHAVDETHDRLKKLGVDAYLEKPFSMDALMSHIQKCFESNGRIK